MAIELVAKIRSRIPITTIDTLYLIRKAEIRAFREKSFFYYKEYYDLYRIPFPMVKPDPEIVLKDEADILPMPNIVFTEEGVESKAKDLSSKEE